MTLWVWIALVLAGSFLLLLFLFRIRYRLDWEGGLDFSAELDYGVPGLFKRAWKFPSSPDSPELETVSPTASEEEISTPDEKQKHSEPQKRPRSKRGFDRNRGQRALFLFITDPAVLRGLIGYGLRSLRLSFRLLHLELKGVIGHSNPAKLGRWAGYWYATKPFIPTRRVDLAFDFENPKTSLRLHVRGGFSAAQALAYLLLLIGSFPWFLLVKKAWRSWRNPQLRGWRAWVFRRMR